MKVCPRCKSPYEGAGRLCPACLGSTTKPGRATSNPPGVSLSSDKSSLKLPLPSDPGQKKPPSVIKKPGPVSGPGARKPPVSMERPTFSANPTGSSQAGAPSIPQPPAPPPVSAVNIPMVKPPAADAGPPSITDKTDQPAIKPPPEPPPHDENEDSLIGQTPLGQYLIKQKIGEGGFGAVYLAAQRGVGRKAVIKVLKAKLAGSEVFIKRFRREAAVLAALDHHHLVRLYNFGELDDGQLFLAMEYGGDRTLEDEIRLCGRLSEARALRITAQVCSALQEAHSRGIVHRDLKPANIILGQKDGQDWVKVVDVGIAKMLDTTDIDDGQSLKTGAGAIIGTPAYFSPEQARGLPLDGRSDVYTMGCILYKMLSTKLPVEGKTPIDYLRAHCMEPPIPLKDRGVTVSPSVGSTLLKRILCKDPADRMTAAEMAEWAAEEVKKLESTAPKGKRRYIFAGAAGVIVLLGVVLLAAWALGRGEGRGEVRGEERAARRIVTSTMISSQLMPAAKEEKGAPDAGAAAASAAVPSNSAPAIAAPNPAPAAAPPSAAASPAAAPAARPSAPAPTESAKAASESDVWKPRLRHIESLVKANRIPDVISQSQKLLKQRPPDDVKWQLYKALGLAEFYNGDTNLALKYETMYRPHCPATELPATDAFIAKLREESGLDPKKGE